MGVFYFQKGLVISRLGQHLEYVARTSEELYFEDPLSGQRVTLTETEFWEEFQTLRIKIVDAFSSPKLLTIPEENTEEKLTSLTSLPPAYQDDVLRKHQYIAKLRSMGISKGQTHLIQEAVTSIAKQIEDPQDPPKASTVQSWWRKLEKNRYEAYALISGYAFRNRSKPLDDDSEKFLQNIIDTKYCISTRPTVSGAYRAYLSEFKLANATRKVNGLPLLRKIGERSFYRRIDERPKQEIMTARLGREVARHHFNMIKGHLPARHPLDVVEIDHTPMNLFVLDDQCFLPLGRPWLTAIKDRFSGVLLGFYVSFQATGLNSIFGAIKHSLSSHHMAYQLWPDLENPWPAYGRGRIYESDRGADFISSRYRLAITDLGAEFEYCKRRTPWLKGSIERFFLTLEETFFEAMPGRTFANWSKRGDYNSKKDAVVRFSTLIYLLHKWAADFHNVFNNERKQAQPLQMWLDGIGSTPPPYPRSMESLDIILGEHHAGTLSQEGIRFQWLTYTSEQLRALMGNVDKGKKLNFAIPQENLGSIYVEHPQSHHFFPVPCTRRDYAEGLSLFQHQYLRKESGIRLERESAVEVLVETRARIASVLGEEVLAKENATKARLARIAGINSESVLKGKKKSIINPFEGQTVDPPEPKQKQKPKANPFTDVPQYGWGQ